MDTLVLSPAYEPMVLVGWQKAMSLWLGGRVEVLEQYEDRLVRSVRLAFQLPAVVRFPSAKRTKRRWRVTFSKRNVYARDKGLCQYCGADVPLGRATYDHVVPRSKGGRTCWTNVVIACLVCNQKKGARTPEEARLLLRAPPVEPRSLPRPPDLRWQAQMPSIWRPYLDWSS